MKTIIKMRITKMNEISTPFFSLVLLYLCASSFGLHNTSYAADVPGFNKKVALSANEQTAPDFIHALFSQLDVPVRLDADVAGKVNGKFDGSAQEVFQQIANTFNIHLYYDNSIAYVYHSNQIIQRILTLSNNQSKKLIKTARKLNLPDDKNRINTVTDGGLIVTGNKRFVQQIEELAVALQKNIRTPIKGKPKIVVREFKLAYASADDENKTINGNDILIPGVATMLREFINQDKSRSSVTITKTQLSSRQSNTVGEEKLPEVLSSQKISQQSSIVASIVAHPQTNSIWVRDTADRMPVYEDMIASMDSPPEMIEIEATIIDINSERQRELGVNWRALNGENEFLLGEGSFQDELLNPGQDISPQGEGGILSLVLGDRTKFISRMRALENLGAARIVSKPHVLTKANAEAILGSTNEFFIRLEGDDAVSLERQVFGTVLRVTPRVFNTESESGINLQINIEDGSQTSRFVDQIPGIERTVVSTQALVKEGQSLLLGGLVRESSSDGVSKVPFLGDIPGVGRLFKTTTKNTTKIERLFLITPRIASSTSGVNTKNEPILQGKIDDIIATSDRRTSTGFEQTELKQARADQSMKDAKTREERKSGQPIKASPMPEVMVSKTDLADMINTEVPSSNVGGSAVSTQVQAARFQRPVTVWKASNWSDQEDGWQEVTQ